MDEQKPLEVKKKPGADLANTLYWVLRQGLPPFLVVVAIISAILWVTIYTLKYLPPAFWQGSIGFIVGVLSFGATVVLLFILYILILGVRPMWLYFRARYIDKQPLALYMDAARAKFVVPKMDPLTGALELVEGKIKKSFSSVAEYRFLLEGQPFFLISAFHDSVIHPVHMAAGDVLAKEADLPEGQSHIKKEGIEVPTIALLTHGFLKTFLDAVVNPASRDIYVKNEIQRQRAGEKSSFFGDHGGFIALCMGMFILSIVAVILWNSGILRQESWCAAKQAGQAAASGGGFKLPALPGLGL